MKIDELMPELDFLNYVMAQVPGFVTVFLGREHRFAFINENMQVMLNCTDIIGRTLAEIAPPFLQVDIAQRLDRVWDSGQAIMVSDVPYYAHDPRGNQSILCYGDFLHQPIKNNEEEIIGVYIQGVDVTERKLAQENLDYLKQQSIGRVRDLIALIRNSVDQVLETADTLDGAFGEVQLRFDHLVKVQMLALDNENKNLHVIIKNAISLIMPHAHGIVMRGRQLELNFNYETPIALLVQEMARNAVNHDIAPTKIQISWKLKANKMLTINWTETDLDFNNYHFPNLNSSVVSRLITLNSRNKVKSSVSARIIKYKVTLCLDDI